MKDNWPPIEKDSKKPGKNPDDFSDKKKIEGLENNTESEEKIEENFEKIKEEFSEWIDNHLKEIYNGDFVNMDYETPVEKWIAEKLNINIEKDFLLNQNDKYISSLVKIFLDKLYNFSSLLLSKRTEEDEKKKEIFLYNLDNLYVNQEPDLTSFLSIEDQVVFAGKTNKISFLASDFGYDINLRIINSPELISNSEKIVEKISVLNIEEKINSLENLAKIALEYEFTFYGDIWEPGDIMEKPITEFSLKLKRVINDVSERDASPIVKFFANKFSSKIVEREQEGLKLDGFFERDKSSEYSTEIAGSSSMVDISRDFVGIYDIGNPIPSVILDKDEKILSYEDMHKRKIIFDDSFDSELIRFLHRPEVFLIIEKELGIDLRKITLRDQIYFMQFLVGENQETFDSLREVLGREGLDKENFLKSFLSTVGDLEFGDNLIKISEDNPIEISNKIFEKYSEIVDSVDDIDDLLNSEFDDVENKSAIVDKIKNDLLKKGKDFLTEFSKEENDDHEYLIKKLSQFKGETELFKSAFKKLSECDEVDCSLSNWKSLSLDILKSEDVIVDEDIISKMRTIYEKNYPDEESFSEEFRSGLLKSLDIKIANKNTEFYLIKKEGELIGYNSFTDMGDDVVEFANFNLDKKLSGSRIGSALLDETLFKIAENKKIRAVALKNSRILNHYVEDLGFKVINNNKGEFVGQEIVEIELDMRKEKSED